MVTATAHQEKLTRYQTTLDRLKEEKAAPNIIKAWEFRITRLEQEPIIDEEEVKTMPAKVADKPPVDGTPTLTKAQQKVADRKAAREKEEKEQVKAQKAVDKAAKDKAAKAKATREANAAQKKLDESPSRTPATSASPETSTKTPKTTPKAQTPTPGSPASKNKDGTPKAVVGTPGKNNVVYPDLNKTDPTFGGKGSLLCLCGCKVKTTRGGKFSVGHAGKAIKTLDAIKAGTVAGTAILPGVLEELKGNKTLTIGTYSANDVIKLSTRKGGHRNK